MKITAEFEKYYFKILSDSIPGRKPKDYQKLEDKPSGEILSVSRLKSGSAKANQAKRGPKKSSTTSESKLTSKPGDLGLQ